MITLTFLVLAILAIAIALGVIFAIGLSGLAIILLLFGDVLIIIGIIWIIKKIVRKCKKNKKK